MTPPPSQLMLSTLLKIERADRTVMVYADRSRMNGRGAEAMTANVIGALDGFDAYRLLPTHNREYFAWTAEFDSPEAAVSYLLLLLNKTRGR